MRQQHVQSPQWLLIQVALLFLLEKKVILSGPYLAQCPHFDMSKCHHCPGTGRKTFPLPTNVSSGTNGFNRSHFFWIHCWTDDATDLEATLSSLNFLTHDTLPEFDFGSFCGYSFPAHLLVLLVLINLVLHLSLIFQDNQVYRSRNQLQLRNIHFLKHHITAF